MANQWATRQWFLDTPYSIASITGPHIAKSDVLIENIEYNGYTTATNPVVFVDKNNNIVWQCTGATDLSTIRSGKIGWSDGLFMITKGDGTGVCQVYLK